jgi:hypothetical protein
MNIFYLLFTVGFFVFPGESVAQKDKQSWCEVSNTHSKAPQLLVLFDKTENYEKALILNIIEKISDEKEKLSEGARVSFFTFDKETGYHASIFTDSFCVAGNPSVLLSNKRDIKLRKKRENDRISQFFVSQNPTSGTNGSPIADALISMSRSQLLAATASEIKLILISDLIENSEKARLGSKKLNVEDANKFANDLSAGQKFPIKTNVIVLYVQRQKYLLTQSGESLELLWKKFFRNVGVVSEVAVVKIQ